ncbi:MAG: hypothetical protein ACJAY8_001547, partial [Sphingobacteriales bacterium]
MLDIPPFIGGKNSHNPFNFRRLGDKKIGGGK